MTGRDEKTFECCQAPVPGLFVPCVGLSALAHWDGRSGAGGEQVGVALCHAWAGGTLIPARDPPFPQQSCSQHGLHCSWSSCGGKLVPPTPAAMGDSHLEDPNLWVPPIPFADCSGGDEPLNNLHVPPNCSLGSEQGENELSLPLLPCRGCRGLLHELAVNQNARGRQFCASETCPHQGLGEGGEPRVSR